MSMSNDNVTEQAATVAYWPMTPPLGGRARRAQSRSTPGWSASIRDECAGADLSPDLVRSTGDQPAIEHIDLGRRHGYVPGSSIGRRTSPPEKWN
jgi:hypothetical protein